MPKLSGRAVRDLTQTDRRDHEAIVALDPETGDVVGLGEYVRSVARPNSAEVALAVTDEWQERGVGTVLLHGLCAHARENDIATFTAGAQYTQGLATVTHLLGALVVAIGWGTGLAALTSVVSAFGFGYFRDWPNDVFDPTDLRNWVVIGVFLLITLMANALEAAIPIV